MNYRHLIIVGALSTSLPVLAQEVTLKISHFLPSVASAQKRVLQPWCDELHKESNGRIACQFYPSMQLGGTPAQLVDQVKNGVADIVWTAPGYSTGRFPVIEAFELPFMVSDSVSGSRALWKYYQQYAQKEFADYKVLSFQVDGGQAIHTSKKQVTGLSSFSGLKLRSATRLGAQALIAMGASPVAMPPAQVTEAIDKGVVDGSLASWELVFQTKLNDVVQFHAQPRPGQSYPTAIVLMLLMNKQKYASLPPDLKALIDKHSGPSLNDKFGAVFDDEARISRKRVVEETTHKITDFSDAEMAAMRKATAVVQDNWIKQVNKKGLDGKKLADAARALASEK